MYVEEMYSGMERVWSQGLTVVESASSSLDIVLREGTATINGSIELGQNGTVFADQRLVAVTPGGPPVVAGAAAVVLVPDASRRENAELFFRSSATPEGRFEFPNVPPGQYKLFAVVNIPTAAFADAAFISRYESLGQFISVPPGATLTQQLRLLTEIRSKP
jgi:hypothetical protein